MAKKIDVKKKANPVSGRTASYSLPELHSNGWLFLKDFRFQAIVLVIVGVLFYANTYKNQYALDDDIIMKQNMYVQKGFSGIGEILANDAYKSYYESMGVEQQLSGGRYRPLSIVTFAIEQQIFGECYGERYTEVRDSLFQMRKAGVNNEVTTRLVLEQNDLDKKIKATNMDIAGIRHGFQVFWFVLSLVVLLWLFREHIFRSNTDIAFLTVLLFAIHPIHTEVVANVKSRDEIFSLLFIALTFIFFFRYDLKKKRKDLIWAMVCFFLAFLSKEYALVMVILIPASLILFNKRKLSDLVYLAVPIGVVVVVYGLVHIGAVGNASGPADDRNQDVLNDPYLYASPQQTFLSKINRLDDYLWLLIWPWPLVSDYSYQHFPYSDVSDLMVWVSLLVNIGLVALLIWLCQKRHPLAFALLIYLLFFALICNVVFDIGATMGERLIYHSSLGFCMALAWLMVKGVEKIRAAQPYILTGLFILISIPAFFATTQRNAEWQNDFTLFTTDVKTHPRSVLANGNAGARYMDYALYFLGRDTIIGKDTISKYGRDTVKVHRYADTAKVYLLKATQMHKKYAVGYLNLGLCYYYTDHFDLAAEAWGKAHHIFPSNPQLVSYEQMFVGQAINKAARRDYAGAAEFYHYATITLPTDKQAWADYAGASYMAQDFTTAKDAFLMAIKLNPDKKDQLENGYRAATQNESMLLSWQQDSSNVNKIVGLAGSYFGTQQFYPTSRRLLNKALVLQPQNTQAKKLLDSLNGLEAAMKINERKIK
jgi:tetratricopeptide (TPR) repeat protein